MSLCSDRLQRMIARQASSAHPVLAAKPPRQHGRHATPFRHHRTSRLGPHAAANGNSEDAQAPAGDQPAAKPFEGVGWISEEAAALREEEEAAQQQQQQQATQGGPPMADGNGLPAQDEQALSAADVDELAPERKPFHQRLGRAAQRGDVAAAEAVLEEMMDSGLPPGQRAYHGLVFAYIKAGDAKGAWSASRRAHASGALLLAESYILLIHGYMQEDMVMDAQVLLASMQSAPHVSARSGWLVLLQSLLRKGYHQKAAEELARGQQQGWAASSAVYEAMVTATCEAGHLAEAIEIVNRMKREGVQPMARHVHPILRAYAAGGALEYLQEKVLLDVATSADIRIDTECFNCLLRGYIDNRHRGFGYNNMDKLKYEVEGLMAKYEVEPNARYHALQVEGFTLDGDQDCMQEATRAFREMARLSIQESGRGAPCPLPAIILCQYLSQQATMAPADLQLSLAAMQSAGFQLPAIALLPNQYGLSIVTSWLHARFARLCSTGYRPETPVPSFNDDVSARQQAAMEEGAADGTPPTRLVRVADVAGRAEEGAEPIFVDIEVNEEGAVVDTDGKVMAPSKLTVTQLAAELQARGLMTEGSRREMYKRVQAARRSSAGSESVAQTKRKQAESYGKYIRERGQKEEAREASKREVSRLEDGIVQLAYTEGDLMAEITLDPETLGLDQFDDDDDDEDEQEATTADAGADSGDDDEDDDEDDTAAEEPEDDLTMSADASGSLIDEDLDDDEMNDPQLDRVLFWYNSNFRAQTSVALRLLKSVEALGCRAMPSDIGMLVKGAVAEQNTRLAGPLFDVVQRYEEELGEDTAGALHGALLEMLIEAGQPGQAKVLSERMDDAGYDVDELLMRQLEWQLTQSQRASDRETVAA